MITDYSAKEPKFTLEPLTHYAFTLNPVVQAENANLSSTRWSLMHNYFLKSFQTFTSFQFNLYMEVSEPKHLMKSQCTRIHLHGTIYILDLPDFLLTELNKLSDIGDLKICQITDSELWNTYIQKQSKYWISLDYDYIISKDAIAYYLQQLEEKEMKKLSKRQHAIWTYDKGKKKGKQLDL